jgi:hypothetical protein
MVADYPRTSNLGLPLIPDGDKAWGQAMRDAMTTLDTQVAKALTPPIIPPATSAAYDISVFVGGCPVLGETILRLVATRPFTLAAAGHQASCGTKPSAAAVFQVLKNGSNVGTLTIDTSGTATSAFAAAVPVVIGDLVVILAPSPQDLTLADVGILLSGSTS